ncbi:MAG TPA: glycosyltransferase family 4 protein, partial [Bryobacteraceae bacterium]|nr:glycosyltransferase family 4 protein [Bryobacteraceae bacterium]
GEDYDVREQLERWERFERRAWTHVDCVVVMSEKDRATASSARRVEVLANGVDPVRFQPSADEPEPGRLLFIGSFAHLPNLLALDFFLREIWPRLDTNGIKLHVIAGSKHEYFYNLHRERLSFTLAYPGLMLEGFVSDVRGAYRRAEIVIAPLLASAGTNIKIMEAMAMGKAIVSTSGGVNGLDELSPGSDILVHDDPESFANAVGMLQADPGERRRIEERARRTAEAVYGWNAIAARQDLLYQSLMSLSAVQR